MVKLTKIALLHKCSIGSVYSQPCWIWGKLLQLPSIRTLKLYIDTNIEDADDSISRLQRETSGTGEGYKAYCYS